ncbi:MAG: protease modulator HflC [Verrucomicrobia bacterium]|nr:protease modulator HflC [Verrucomicrobiota bacterium]
MKRNPITIITAVLVGLIFAALLFLFQVRQTEVAIVTTFGKYGDAPKGPGVHFRLPWPIQNVHRFDNRVQNFEKKFDQTTTRDSQTLLMDVFVGWKVADPRVFLERFGGDVTRAENNLDGLLRDAKNSVVGRHPLNHFISTNPQDLRFDEIEREMLDLVKPQAAANYGIEIVLLGIKQIGLPESVTTKVFERMKAEREKLIKQYRGEGDGLARKIRADAELKREQILAEAERQATIIRGAADARAADALKAFEQEPELAKFLLKLDALEQSLKERSTLILDPQTPPFDLLRSGPPTGGQP